MERDLSPQLYYHSLKHSRDDVLPAAERLGRAQVIGDEELLLLKTAAAYHDSGFLQTYEDHETCGIAIASHVLPAFGYSGPQLDVIRNLIAATRLPQRPSTLLEELICDADLDLLGRVDFIPLNAVLLEERRVYNHAPPTLRAWYIDQIEFLESHRFFTPAAIQSRQAGKMKNLALLKSALAALDGRGQ
jgi:predicted metal-dependent HD superfamily phosphohydrolase